MSKKAPGVANPARISGMLELRRSNAAGPHRNKAKEAKLPGKGHRQDWRKEER